MAADEVDHDAHARMRERSAGMGFDRHAWNRERPRAAQLAVDHLRTVAASRRAKESAVGFESNGRCREAEADKLRRHDPALSGTARVARLGHGSEVFSQAAGLTRVQTQGA